MRQMIWAMSNNNNSLEDLVVYIRSYTRQFLDDHQLPVQFDIPDSIQELNVSGPMKRNLFLVVKEVLHNIIKHAAATGVFFVIQIRDGSLILSIRDNGKGIYGSDQNRFGNGLKNMERRMREINGKISIASEQGTTIVLEVPVLTWFKQDECLD
jgi:signal transduction histidine kinase